MRTTMEKAVKSADRWNGYEREMQVMNRSIREVVLSVQTFCSLSSDLRRGSMPFSMFHLISSRELLSYPRRPRVLTVSTRYHRRYVIGTMGVPRSSKQRINVDSGVTNDQ
jgi:hypothetical protein